MVYRGTITDGDTSNTIDVAVKTIKEGTVICFATILSL